MIISPAKRRRQFHRWVHPQGSYLCALSLPSSFSRLIHELYELFSLNKGATLVAITSIPRSSYKCRRTSAPGSRMWTRPLTDGVRPWSWFAIASKNRSVERTDDRMIAQALYIFHPQKACFHTSELSASPMSGSARARKIVRTSEWDRPPTMNPHRAIRLLQNRQRLR